MMCSGGKIPASRNDGREARGSKRLLEGHRERLRLRMERDGWETLKPYEMVELVLFYAVPRRNVSDVARRLVDRFETVGGVFMASREALMEVPGVSAAMAEWIGLTGELIRSYDALRNAGGIRLSCYQEVLDFLKPRMEIWKEARLWAVYADFNFGLITFSDIRKREEWWDAANTRQMMVRAINNGARYVYMVLWTGNGPADLDDEEIARLESIRVSLKAVDLDLADCLLVGDGGISSMNKQGRLRSVLREQGYGQLREDDDRPD